jgi:hypothetical protein
LSTKQKSLKYYCRSKQVPRIYHRNSCPKSQFLSKVQYWQHLIILLLTPWTCNKSINHTITRQIKSLVIVSIKILQLMVSKVSIQAILNMEELGLMKIPLKQDQNYITTKKVLASWKQVVPHVIYSSSNQLIQRKIAVKIIKKTLTWFKISG